MQALETKVSWLEKIAGPSEFPTSSNEFRFCCPSCYIRSQSQIDDRGWVSLALLSANVRGLGLGRIEARFFASNSSVGRALAEIDTNTKV